MDAVGRETQREFALRILSSWGLDPKQRDQLLGNRENVIAVLSIFESLQSIFSEDKSRAYEWPKRPNDAFDGVLAVELIVAGEIERVRKYLKYHVYNA